MVRAFCTRGFTVVTISSQGAAFQVLDPEGKIVGPVPDLSNERLLELFRWMWLARKLSDKIIALQRQGRATTFGSLMGQEASAVGLAAPLRPEDWLVTSYREIASHLVKGVPLATQIFSFRGSTPPNFPTETHCLPIQIVIGTQLLHAVGIAMAAKIKGDPVVAVGACGDGATSEGDFNEALNWAGVYKAPVVLVVQNNGWAISVPRHKQTAATTIAERGAGFGVPSRLVDGNDILAVYSVMSDSVERARAGEGPTLLELLTYRIGAHTTADDPTRYRDPAEIEAWKAKDPIARFKRYLVGRKLMTDAKESALVDQIEAEINAAVEEAEAMPMPSPEAMFDWAYANPFPRLDEERATLKRYLGE
jgi:pyruvate dehydrogenase E1 component alpha subunit